MPNNQTQLDDFFGDSLTSGTPEQNDGIREAISRTLTLEKRIRLLPSALSFHERYGVIALAIIAVASIIAIPFSVYNHFTKEIPANGGRVVEGILGEPRLVNPLLAPANDVDRDASALIYSGLYRYDGSGVLVPDFAESMPEITADGLSYSVTIKPETYWHDGLPVTADDVVFTVQTAQNPDYGAPSTVQTAWTGVTIERASDRVVVFRLTKGPYAQFLNNLTLGIIPKHVWQDVRPINFSLSEYNIKPIGSGPFKFKSFTKDELGRITSYKVETWERFYENRPFLDEIELKFFASEDELIGAFNQGDIDSIGYISGANVKQLRFLNRINLESLRMPRYYAMYFNQTRSKALADKNVRLALNEATDRVAIINKTLDGNAFLVNSPMISGILPINTNVRSYVYDQSKAVQVLESSGWKAEVDGVRARGAGNRLEITITTSTWPELASVAELVREQWERIGVRVTVQALPIAQLQQVMKDRSYQVLLFGAFLSLDPDPISFWHSNFREFPGQNLALYNNKTADNLLEEARQTLNPVDRYRLYDEFQRIIIEDIPAVFLYSPHNLYGIDKDIKGFKTSIIATPSERFTNARSWYIDTSRDFR